jgi:hypothetical protein
MANNGFNLFNQPQLDPYAIAMKTQVAEKVQTWTLETITAATQTVFVATQFPTQTSTPEPSATNTLLPSSTLSPSNSSTASNTPIILLKDWVGFIDDISVKDNTVFTPGAHFTKIWRLKNIGTHTWTTEYTLVFVGGDSLGAKTIIPLSFSIAPGQTADFSVDMTAPKTSGSYNSQWMLRNQNGILFGVCDGADSTFWAKIRVAETSQVFTNDFVKAYCSATWSSQNGNLPCPGDTNSTSGFVLRLTDTDLENRQENEPTLWMRPNKGGSGWIKGIYPPVTVKPNDHFRAWVGCLDGSEGCDVTFQLGITLGDGSVKTLGEWREFYDGKVTTID